MRRMRWFKIAAIGAGILIAFLVVGSVIGFIIGAVTKLVLAALVVGAVVVAVKVARSRREVTGKKAEREVRDRDYEQYSKPLPRSDIEPAAPSYPASPARPPAHNVDDELARLKREMGSLAAPLPIRPGELGHGRLHAVHAYPRRGPAAHHPQGELGRAADDGHRRGGVARREPVGSGRAAVVPGQFHA